ncbi:CEPT1 [Lepeophtheirus salmonis]|uniref:CEPT1 n=1 Tax=Lepeophtheirus salmonis TaxID=72036 RepID=A0A7R8H8D8_LEPSM|nr:CEPT1 [Lepeophtheirus salmonis]CAF2940087.1 CEPT1 [Lepeophtheirus salmonis]
MTIATRDVWSQGITASESEKTQVLYSQHLSFRSLVPNMVEYSLIVNALTSLILVFETNCATTEAPGYAWYLCALGLFIYQTLDAIDGKQARRTNTTSSLGELFDHGCDSITTIFITPVFSMCILLLAILFNTLGCLYNKDLECSVFKFGSILSFLIGL